jgi:Family of unknown function (DUF6328)
MFGRRAIGAVPSDMPEQAERRDETETERLDRNLGDLLQELRVAFPGVQILFAFLLVLPFQNGWPEVTDAEKVIYFLTLLLTALSSICFIAPSARHRIRFRHQDLRWVIESSNRLMILGLVFLAGAFTSALLLVTMFVFSVAAAVVVASLIAAIVVWLWFGGALARKAARR